jgi:hypothetical protein
MDGTAVTGTGYVVGTAAYLAPEQVRGEWVGPEADVYALGLVLLEALTARREYPGALVESATARLHRPPGIPSGLPASLHTALQAMTALEPAARPAAAQVAALLAVEPRGRRGAHRRTAGRPASPRIAGAATLLAIAAAVTAAALPSAQPLPVPRPSVQADPAVVGAVQADRVVVGAVPQPDASAWLPASAVVPVDRVAATLGEGVEAARKRAAAVAKALSISSRPRDARSPRR